jgi:hypothetical protein
VKSGKASSKAPSSQWPSDYQDSQGAKMGFDYKPPKVRAYYADWVRALAI